MVNSVLNMLTLRCLKKHLCLWVCLSNQQVVGYMGLKHRYKVNARNKVMRVIIVQVVINPWVCASSHKGRT